MSEADDDIVYTDEGPISKRQALKEWEETPTEQKIEHVIACSETFDSDDPPEAAYEIWQHIKDDFERHNDMLALVDRVANLNKDAGEIGEGMLNQLVDEARRILGRSE